MPVGKSSDVQNRNREESRIFPNNVTWVNTLKI